MSHFTDIGSHQEQKSGSVMMPSMLIVSPFSVWPDKAGAEPSSSHCGTGDPGDRRWIWPPRVTSEHRLFPRLHCDSDRAPDHCHRPLSAAGLHHVWQERGSVCIHFFIYLAVSTIDAIMKKYLLYACFFLCFFSIGKKEMQEQTSKYTWLPTVNEALKFNSVCFVLFVKKDAITKHMNQKVQAMFLCAAESSCTTITPSTGTQMSSEQWLEAAVFPRHCPHCPCSTAEPVTRVHRCSLTAPAFLWSWPSSKEPAHLFFTVYTDSDLISIDHFFWWFTKVMWAFLFSAVILTVILCPGKPPAANRVHFLYYFAIFFIVMHNSTDNWPNLSFAGSENITSKCQLCIQMLP